CPSALGRAARTVEVSSCAATLAANRQTVATRKTARRTRTLLLLLPRSERGWRRAGFLAPEEGSVCPACAAFPWSGGEWRCAPRPFAWATDHRLQWRDRAGVEPASLLPSAVAIACVSRAILHLHRPRHPSRDERRQ